MSESALHPPVRRAAWASAAEATTARAALWAAAVFAGAFAAVSAAWGRAFNSDTWITLTAGREVWHHGLPHVDRLTVAGHGRPWIDQQWLAQLAYYGAWRAGGDAAVGILSALAVAAAAGILAFVILRRGAPTIVMLMVVLGVPLAELILFAEPRAQSFAYPLMAVLVWLMLADADHGAWRTRLLAALPLLVLWANLHGSVLLWALVFAAFCGWRAVVQRLAARPGALRYAALGAASLTAPLATPYGADIVSYYRTLLTDPAMAVIAEWRPATVEIAVAPFAVAMFAFLLLTAYAHGRGLRLPWPQVVLAGALALLGLYAVRYEVFFGLAVAPLLAQVVTALRAATPKPGRDEDRIGRLAVPVAGAFAVVGLAAGLVTAAAPAAKYTAAVSTTAVEGTARYAAAHTGARILADDITGSALLWEHPELAGRIGYDSRIEIYPQAPFMRYAHFLSVAGRRWLAPARGYQVLSVSCADRPDLCTALVGLPGWRIVARDDGGIAAARRG